MATSPARAVTNGCRPAAHVQVIRIEDNVWMRETCCCWSQTLIARFQANRLQRRKNHRYRSVHARFPSIANACCMRADDDCGNRTPFAPVSARTMVMVTVDDSAEPNEIAWVRGTQLCRFRD
jgi:hypothetical protein